MIHTITIPNWRPNLLNELMNCHWAKAAKLKRASRNLIGCYTAHLPKATVKRRLTLHVVLGKGQRKFDIDAPWKDLLDALVHAGMLKDDSEAWAELVPLKFSRGEMASIIILEDMHG